MAYRIQTSLELFNKFITNFEKTINQTIPATDQAYMRVLAAQETLIATDQYKFIADRIKQNFVITATGEDLDRIGSQYGVVRKPAIAAVVTIEQVADIDTIILATTDYVGDSNGVRYLPDSDQVSVTGLITSTLTASVEGVVGNLVVGSTLTMGIEVPGASANAVVTVIETEGTNTESDESYRARVLTEIRTPGGGGTSADYRKWATETPGVIRAYPYSGLVENEIEVWVYLARNGATPPLEEETLLAHLQATYGIGSTIVGADIETYMDTEFTPTTYNTWAIDTSEPSIAGPSAPGPFTLEMGASETPIFDLSRIDIFSLG